jgi:cell surface protein SprA
MAVRSVNGTYNLTQGTILPGFNPTPKYMGMDADFNAPGWPFILGSQDPNIRYKAKNNGWLTTNSRLTTPFSQTRNKDLSLKANVEPAPDLRIQLDMKKSSMSSYQEIFRFDDDIGDFTSLSPSMSGSYKVSMLTIKTAFSFSDNASIDSKVFHEFEKNIDIIKSRFESITSQEYNRKSQDVLIPAFIAAYSGNDVNSAGLSPFPNIP